MDNENKKSDLKSEPKWKRRKADRPGEIIGVAMKAFIANGFERTTLNDIAKLANITKPALYRYFDSKNDLLIAVVDKMVESRVDFLNKAIKPFNGPFFELVLILNKIVSETLSHPEYSGILRMILSESWNNPEISKIWYENFISKIFAAFENLILEAQKKGEIPAGNPQAYFISIISPMILGFIVQQLFEPYAEKVPTIKEISEIHSQIIARSFNSLDSK